MQELSQFDAFFVATARCLTSLRFAAEKPKAHTRTGPRFPQTIISTNACAFLCAAMLAFFTRSPDL